MLDSIPVFEYPFDVAKLRNKLENRKVLYERTLISEIDKHFQKVEELGDVAVKDLTRRFDDTELSDLRVSEDYIKTCIDDAPSSLLTAIEHAKQNIEQVNRFLLPDKTDLIEIRPGTLIGEKTTPLASVGLWIPARKAPLVSTALMLVGAAKVAGVQKIVVGMAPNQQGKADPATVVAAKLAGATDIIVGNGVGVIAGFSIGTKEIPEVDGIFGPGPGGIAAAMSIAFSYGKKTVLGIGPTDSAILCDEQADPEILAYDLLNEAEHGKDSSSVLVTTSRDMARSVRDHLLSKIEQSCSSRREILQHVFSADGRGAIIFSEDLDKAIEFINDYAPEHIIIKCKKSTQHYALDHIVNAGEILLGEFAPFTAANYAIGITAVLPTNGYAKSVSGITAKDMVKVSTVAELNRDALFTLLPTIQEIGKWENLPNHVVAVEKRF